MISLNVIKNTVKLNKNFEIDNLHVKNVINIFCIAK